MTKKTAPREKPIMPMKPVTRPPPIAAPAACAPAYWASESTYVVMTLPVKIRPDNGSRSDNTAEEISSFRHAFAADVDRIATMMPTTQNAKKPIAPQELPFAGEAAKVMVTRIAPIMARIKPPMIPARTFIIALLLKTLINIIQTA